MYIQGLNTETIPVELEWGKNHKHVPLNIKCNEINDGTETKQIYTYDCVERVPVPVTVDGIVNTAIKANFTQTDIDYALANIFKSDDEKVKDYINFVKVINEQAISAGY